MKPTRATSQEEKKMETSQGSGVTADSGSLNCACAYVCGQLLRWVQHAMQLAVYLPAGSQGGNDEPHSNVLQPPPGTPLELSH